MKLRHWQAECISKAYGQYQAGQSHFLCLATPAAGKTKMAALLARQLLDQSLIDLVVCFAPSVIVADDFRAELEVQTGKRMDGLIGSRGCAMTYQAMLGLSADFWALFSQHRVFVIFDEIHHCAGQTLNSANAWGERIICEIQGRAIYTLALTGTPWRSDRIPIVLSSYCEEQRQIHCDYQYGLHKAVVDRVCRIPNLILIDNDKIRFNDGETPQQFTAIKELLEQSHCTYQQLLESEALITYIVRKANNKLESLRVAIPNAGGLIVAASVAHAHQIARLLKTILNEEASIATYYEENAAHIIRHFKMGTQKWIISVGMISEGTNIPRLRVCCHLTRVKTELYFRQVLGRILRSSGEEGETAYFYMPAERTLTQYAQRLAEDIPATDILEFECMPSLNIDDEVISPSTAIVSDAMSHSTLDLNFAANFSDSVVLEDSAAFPSSLAQSYESTINMFGRFRQEILSLTGLPLDNSSKNPHLSRQLR